MTARILVVEDEGIIAADIAQSLESQGHDVVAICASGEDAILKNRELRPELVLMDIHLAGKMNGTEAAKNICDESDPALVYLTAYADPDTFESAQAAAPFGYLVKPFDDQTLHTTIETALRRRTSRELDQQRLLVRNTALEGLSEAVAIVRDGGELEHANAAALQVLGADMERLPLLLDAATDPTGPPVGDWLSLESKSPFAWTVDGHRYTVSVSRVPYHWVVVLTEGKDGRAHDAHVKNVKSRLRERADQLI